MHNLNYRQTIIIGVACLFGIPAAVGIVVAHFTSLGGGIFSGLLVMAVIALVAQRRMAAIEREKKAKMKEATKTMDQCRNCIHWRQVGDWTGNCRKHPWTKNKYGDDATPTSMRCEDYVDRHAAASAKEAICKK